MKRDKLDDILKGKLHDFDAGTQAPAWSAMERRLVLSANEAGAATPRRFRLNSLIRYSAAAVLLLVMGLGIFHLSHRSTEIAQERIAADSSVQETALFQNAVTADMIAESEAARNPVVSRVVKTAQTVAVITPPADRSDPLEHLRKNDDVIAEIAEENPVLEMPVEASDNVPSSAAKTPPQRRERPPEPRFRGFDWGNDHPQRLKRSSWLASVSTTAFASSRNATSGSAPLYGPNRFSAFMTETSYVKNTIDVSGADLKHKFPISVGLMVRKRITDRFDLGIGLNYSYLESTSELKGQFDYQYSQKLHYLGIPLTAYYSIFGNKRFDVYAYGGFMMEKAVSAKGFTKVYSQGTYSSTVTNTLSTKGLLWSANAGLGVSYDFVNNFGIYMAPGVNYYFPNHNQPSSYRTENPWSFNLSLGFQFKF